LGTWQKRSELGKWLDQNGYTQEDLVNASGLNRNTVSKVCSDPDYIPSGRTMRKIMKAVRQIDPSLKAHDFWDI